MAIKKNQHYVPQMYLRLFSVDEDGSQVGMFYLGKELFKSKIPLRHQAKEDFFYGKDGELEEELSKLETKAAPLLKDIISGNTIPLKNSDDYNCVLLFTLVLANRTKEAIEHAKETTSKVINEMMKYDERVSDKAGKYQIYPSNLVEMVIASVSDRMYLAVDLKLKLLINKTGIKFITSDHPVVKYNQYLEKRKHPGGIVGVCNKGASVVFPYFSRSHALFLR